MKHAGYGGLCVAFLTFTFGMGIASHAHAARTTEVAPADTVLRGGFVYTVDSHNSVQQAIAVQAGRIVYVGTDAGVSSYIGQQTKVIDLHGRMVMPGLVDLHNHAISGGAQLLECDLNYAPLTVAQFQQHIQACLEQAHCQGTR